MGLSVVGWKVESLMGNRFQDMIQNVVDLHFSYERGFIIISWWKHNVERSPMMFRKVGTFIIGGKHQEFVDSHPKFHIRPFQFESK